MTHRLSAAFALAASIVIPGVVSADTLVIGNGLASDCSQEAMKGRFDRELLTICDLALETQVMPRTDTAKTYVNRGVIHLRRGSYDKAERDFASAERLWRDLPEVFINRGAVRIHQRRFQEAISEISKGLALNPFEPEKAYYNRAVAKEQLDDLQGAYLDFRKAQELKPDWDEPQKQLKRFIVQPRPR